MLGLPNKSNFLSKTMEISNSFESIPQHHTIVLLHENIHKEDD